MIPISLSLSNFMPYREIQDLNFSGIHVASICGDNGSGKSSLIDAITWALWGKSRAKTDDDLIYQNQNATQVQFDFAVGDQVYRVIRKHTRPRSKRTSGQSSLDLFISNDNGLKPISGDRITETETKIVDILHMDFDTFVNSAFLRQGHADEFTVARPTERKAVLSNILGLSSYDRLEARARQLAVKLENEKYQLEANLRDIERELEHKPEYERELSEAETELGSSRKEIAMCQSNLTELRRQSEALNIRQQQVAQIDEQVGQTTRDLSRWSQQAGQYRLRSAEYERFLNERQRIEDGHARLLSARQKNEELNQKLRLVNTLNERVHQLDMAIMQASQSLLREHAMVTGKLSELQLKTEKIPSLKTELQRAESELSTAKKSEESALVRRQGLLQLQAEMQQLHSERNRVERDIAEVKEKLDLLTNETGAKCPLCEQDLTGAHLDLIKAKYAEEMLTKSRSIKSLVVQISNIKTELSKTEHDVAREEKAAREAKSNLQVKVGLLEREVAGTEEAGKEVETHCRLVADLEERMARKDYALTEQSARQMLDERIASLDYDPESHECVRGEIAGLEQWDVQKRKLEEADRELHQVMEAACKAEEAARELQNALATLEAKKTELSFELETIPSISAALNQAEAEYRELSSKQSHISEVLGSAREKLNRCARLEISRKEKNDTLARASKEEGIYRELAEAFGKRGVQALLIEVALPEIEDEANRLLARMTDNRMHVKFETQRETKKGDVLETLDIDIADELGTRSYEMFSGGEAFRINFAIRIALSKVLARRAGAPLPTLIIDEGFGTQDADGIEKLKEAITSVQDDFKKILVITHIDDFRDAFPVRIDVVKTGSGSTVEVN